MSLDDMMNQGKEGAGFVNDAAAQPSCSAVYVGNLAWSVSWQDLKDHFQQVGVVVRAEVFTEGRVEGGRSKGCGTVEFEDAEAAKRAISELNDTDMQGRRMFVREDRGARTASTAPRGGRAPRGPRGAGRTGGGVTSGCQLFVGNLTYATTWQDLKDVFCSAGAVEYADVVKGRDGRSKGFGIVRYSTVEEANAAISTLNGTELDGRVMTVREDARA